MLVISDYKLFGDKKLVKHTGSSLCFFSAFLCDSRQVAEGKVLSEPIGPSSFSTGLSLVNLLPLSSKAIHKSSVRSADYQYRDFTHSDLQSPHVEQAAEQS